MRRSILAVISALSLVSPAAFSAAGLPFNSSFETGDFSEWMGGITGRSSVTNEDASHGAYAMKGITLQGQGSDHYRDFYFGNHPRIGGEAVSLDRGLWIAFDSKFDNGFVWDPTASVHKILLVNFDDENSRRRYQIIINTYVPTREYFIEHLVWNADRSFQKALPAPTQNIQPYATVRVGQWDRIKLFLKPNTPGQSNGVVRMWVNGQLKADRTNVPLREGTSFLPNKIIVGNYVTSLGTNGTQRWDNVKVAEADPDNSTVRPNPPVIDAVQ